VYNAQKGNLDSFFPNDYPFYALCPLVKAEFIALEQIEKKKEEKKSAVSGVRTWAKRLPRKYDIHLTTETTCNEIVR